MLKFLKNQKAAGWPIGKKAMNEIERMNITIDLAEEALVKGEMPISACIFFEDQVVAKAYTSEKSDSRLLVHAELKALLEAA